MIHPNGYLSPLPCLGVSVSRNRFIYEMLYQVRSKLDNWGGGLIFIYSCSAQLISFEIDCFYGV